MSDIEHVFYSHINVFTTMQFHHHITTTTIIITIIIIIIIIIVNPLEFRGDMFLMFIFMFLMSNIKHVFSQPSIYIDGWLYGMSMTSVVCNVPVLSQNDSTYHHSVFTT